MTRESPRIPIDDRIREIALREVDGHQELVLVDHAGREETVQVRLLEVQAGRAAAA